MGSDGFRWGIRYVKEEDLISEYSTASICQKLPNIRRINPTQSWPTKIDSSTPSTHFSNQIEFCILWSGCQSRPWLCYDRWNAAFRAYFCILPFTSQNITILYSLSQLFCHMSFGSLKQKVTLGIEIWITPSIKYQPRANSIQLWLGFEPNWSQLLKCPLRVPDPRRRLQWRRRRWRRTRPLSPPSSRSRWSGGTSWGWTAPPPCCPLSASFDQPAMRNTIQKKSDPAWPGLIWFYERQDVLEGFVSSSLFSICMNIILEILSTSP